MTRPDLNQYQYTYQKLQGIFLSIWHKAVMKSAQGKTKKIAHLHWFKQYLKKGSKFEFETIEKIEE